ncbi:unnamed protein product [Candidula unifasciata]|uniref:Carbohydrate sulfotransferase n=1 Tax=Candidula unifasciata TaxID=100452 RepID=A0A8S3ZS59_9EUPU|nr:unnamed protein product [Candidula unifasciata]
MQYFSNLYYFIFIYFYHLSIPDSMTLKNTTPEAFKSMLETYMKFIFVRDPFERLFSAYVDKILIPTILKTRVVKFFMDENLVAKESLPCNQKISFGDFSSLLADAIMQKNFFDWHFSTMSSQCHPCQFNFSMVGKMETFMADVSDCLTQTETAEMLWRHLQIRGFISKTISLPPNQSKNGVLSLENFKSAAIRAYEQSEPRHIRMRQREEAMMEAYSLVPRETLEKLSQLYAEDCLLFDYSCDIDRFLSHKMQPFYFIGV